MDIRLDWGIRLDREYLHFGILLSVRTAALAASLAVHFDASLALACIAVVEVPLQKYFASVVDWEVGNDVMIDSDICLKSDADNGSLQHAISKELIH